MPYEIFDKTFTVTLTSNEFQDLFPNNTVSRFRAKLPVQFNLPSANYKVALAKLFYPNNINNFGTRGAKTVLHVSNGETLGDTEVVLPELQLMELSEIVSVLRNEIKRKLPNRILNEDEERRGVGPEKEAIVICALSARELAEPLKATPLITDLKSSIIKKRLKKRDLPEIVEEEDEQMSQRELSEKYEEMITDEEMDEEEEELNKKDESDVEKTSVFPNEHIHDVDETFMSDAPVSAAQLLKERQEVFEFFETTKTWMGGMMKIVHDPFYTIEERLVLFKQKYKNNISREFDDKLYTWKVKQASWGPMPPTVEQLEKGFVHLKLFKNYLMDLILTTNFFTDESAIDKFNSNYERLQAAEKLVSTSEILIFENIRCLF